MNEYGRSPERSIVTMLAFDTVGSTVRIAGLDPDDAQILLDAILAYIRGKVEGFGGFVASFHGDGGFGVFGWPNSLEDHADLACEAAWAIQHPARHQEVPRSADGKPVAFRIGIHTGLVGFRQLETGVGANLDLVGANVHLAAALQKAAPTNGIVMSAHTRSLCKNTLLVDDFEPVGERFAGNAPYYQLRAAPAQMTHGHVAEKYPFPIVGRDTERRQIKAALKPAPGRPSLAAIIGEPGIGKSRLAMSIVADWEDDGLPVLAFTGNARRQTTPFTMAKSLILAALNLAEDEEAGSVAGALASAGIPQTHIAELGSSIFQLNGAPQPEAPVQTTKQVTRRLVETLATLTKNSHPHLIIEDVHLIDPESLGCLAMMASDQECRHMVTLITGRPEAQSSLSNIAPSILRLEPMRRDEMDVMASKLSGQSGIDKQLIDRALVQADGVPFILEQLLGFVGEQVGKLDLQLPQSVESLIHGRLNKLSRKAKSMVQTISVMGDEVEVGVASMLLDTNPNALRKQADELAHLGLLRGDYDKTLRFQHSIIASACLNTVPKLKRKAVHQAAVGAIMAIYPESDAHYERLAFHAEGAGDGPMALDYLWLAGVQARRSAASASLLTIFKRAMTCIEDLGNNNCQRYVDFVLLACASLLQIGEFDEMRKAVPRALDIARSLDDPDKLCGVLCQLGTLQWFEGGNDNALNTCEEALGLAEQLKSPPLIFASQLMLASVLHGLGRVNDAIAVQEALCARLTDELATARLGAPAVPSSVAYSFLGWFLVETGKYDEALRHVDTALKIAVRHRDGYAEVLARNAQGRILLHQNRETDAMRTLLAAKRICDSEGFDAINPHVTGRLAAAMARAGNTDVAVKTTQELVERTNGDRTGYLEMFNLRLGYGEALFRAGQHKEGLNEVNEALSQAERIDSPCLKLQALGVRICLSALDGGCEEQIVRDRKEMARLCNTYGLVAWQPPDGAAMTKS